MVNWRKVYGKVMLRMSAKIKLTPTKSRVLAAFVSQLIKDKGLTELDPAARADLKRKLMQELNSEIERAYIMAMSDEQLIQMNEMLDTGASDEEIGELFETSGVNYEEVTVKAMQAFRNNFLKEAR